MTFILKNKNRANAAIVLLINFKGKKYEKSTGEAVPVKYWNSTKKRVRVVSEYKEGGDVNDVLEKWQDAADNTVKYFKSYISPPDPPVLFDKLEEFLYKDKCKDARTIPFLTDYMDDFTKKHSIGKSEACYKKYLTTRNKIVDYEKESKTRLKFDDINMDFYRDFRYWFFKKGFSTNYFGNTINTLKQMMDEARLVDALHSNDKYKNREFVGNREDVESVYLNEKELAKILDLEITPQTVTEFYAREDNLHLDLGQANRRSESYSKTRNLFILGAYTGLRVSDFARLKDVNLQGKFIKLRSKKTDAETIIPINSKVKAVLSKINLSKTISDQKINKHIKEVCRMAGITSKVLLHKSNGGKREQLFENKHKLVSTHTARRSFATNAYKAGVPTLAIMKITGHTKESTFLKYIKVSAEENAEMLLKHDFFK